MTTSIHLSTWAGKNGLEPAYARILDAIATLKPRAHYSVVLHGSVLWGDRTVLGSGIPISDVDVLVVGDALSDLAGAASDLRSISEQHGFAATPFFKLSVKFRTIAEIGTEVLSANELGALLHGCTLLGPSRFEVFRPHAKWFWDQAHLALRTRLLYVAEQQKKIISSRYQQVLTRYLAARLLLDIPTVGLVLKGLVGRSYRRRIADFCAIYLKESSRKSTHELQTTLRQALLTKQDPEHNDCPDILTSTNVLLVSSEMLGLKDPIPQDTTKFWLESRPLDLRDRTLWKSSRESSCED